MKFWFLPALQSHCWISGAADYYFADPEEWPKWVLFVTRSILWPGHILQNSGHPTFDTDRNLTSNGSLFPLLLELIPFSLNIFVLKFVFGPLPHLKHINWDFPNTVSSIWNINLQFCYLNFTVNKVSLYPLGKFITQSTIFQRFE